MILTSSHLSASRMNESSYPRDAPGHQTDYFYTLTGNNSLFGEAGNDGVSPILFSTLEHHINTCDAKAFQEKNMKHKGRMGFISPLSSDFSAKNGRRDESDVCRGVCDYLVAALCNLHHRGKHSQRCRVMLPSSGMTHHTHTHIFPCCLKVLQMD